MTLAVRAVQDRAAFGELYDRYAVAVYRYCYRRTGNRELAEDATSAIFTRAFEALPAFRGGSFPAWLFAIAHSVLANARRGRVEEQLPRPLDTLPDAPADDPSPEELMLREEARLNVMNYLRALPVDQRRVVELRLAGLTGAEIAEALGKSVPAVKMLQLRAFKRLRRSLHSPATGKERDDDLR